MNWIAFLTYTVLSSWTPGPNNIISMSSASSYGMKKTFNLMAGIWMGFIIVMILCSSFSLGLANLLPVIEPYMKYIGGSYIMYLAYKIAVSAKKSADGEEETQINSFKKGFILQFLNVKIILYGITAMTTFVIPYNNSMSNVSLFTIILVIIGVSGTLVWAMFGAVFYKYITKYNRIVNIVLAVILSYTALSLMI